MTQDRFPAHRLRVGNDERDAVVAILQGAAADGRLGMDELEERLELALQAKTYGDLDPLVADLSADVPWPALSAPTAPVQRPPRAGYTREDPLRIEAGMSSEKREGVWTVPPFLRISSGMGSVKINCLQATAAAPVVEVEVIGGAGSIVIILPPGWAVDTDRLSKTMGSKTIKVPRDPSPGSPLLVFHGSIGLGSFKIRPASRRELSRIGIDPHWR
jgi:DUF1707 SHOCT-like domain